MKKIIYTTIIYTTILSSLLVFTSCESELDSRHAKPDGFTDSKIEFLYSKGLTVTIENDYGDHWNHVFRFLGTVNQTMARKAGQDRVGVYEFQEDKGRWDNFYMKRMQEFAEMQKIYDWVLTPAEQEIYTPYMETAKVLKAYNTAMATDFFGSMPYKEAWQSRNLIYGKPGILAPKYDTQKDIYYALLADLESAASYLKTAKLNTKHDVHILFPNQDAIYKTKSDFRQWYKFASSLRLRYAMRISEVDPAKAKEVLSKLTLEDLIISNEDNAYTRVTDKTWATDRGFWRAHRESQNQDNEYAYAPEDMVNILTNAQDPRLKVFFQPASDKDGVIIDKTKPIVGYPASADVAKTIVSDKTAAEIKSTYGVLNSVTYRNNYNLPYGVGITASDVYFLLAEAKHRGLISLGDAKDFYNKGITLSVQEYFRYYTNSTDKDNIESEIASIDVSDATLTAWINASSYKFDSGKALEQIATQRWMHLGVLQPYENWSEHRRTDLPVLTEDKDGGRLLNRDKAPVRVYYPSTEMVRNATNFSAVKDDNYLTKRVWWDVK